MNSKMQYFGILLVLVTFCAVNVHSLECFECEGDACDKIQDSMVVTCKSATPTEPPPTPENPIISTVDPTTESSTGTGTTGDSTNTNEVTAETTPPGPEFRRFPRSLSNEYFIKPAELLIQNYKLSAGSIRADPLFSCYSSDIPDSKRKHGCIEYTEANGACNAVKAANWDASAANQDINCYSCESNRCNGSAAFGLSIILLLGSVLMYKLH